MGEFTLKDWLGTDDEACADIVRKKYLIPKNILGHEETIDEFLDRVSIGDKDVRNLIKKRRFIPGGRILAGLGLDKYGIKASLSNCYVLKPPEDNIPSIYGTCGEEGVTYSRGGGCGHDVSKLAPKGARVNNTAKVSTGAVSFMPTFSQVAEQIGQNNRRGALLLSIVDTHPDLKEFITHKRELNTTTGANLSIRISDAFMEAVDKDMDWKLFFDRKETGEHIEKIVKARDIMKLIAKTNWEMAEPGMLFWDTINKYNLMSEDLTFEYAGVNPCGEEPLPAGGSCLLGSMNLSEYYNTKVDMFDTMQFAKDVRIAIHYLNNVLTIGAYHHPLEYQRKTALKYRQVGLGVMGLADLFVKKRIRYGSTPSIDLIHTIGYIMAFEALRASCDLAMNEGSFPACNNQAILQSQFIDYNIRNNKIYSADKREKLLDDISIYGLRNSALLTCAPTGTTSTIFNVSGGIEPIFALEYERTTKTVYDEEKSYIAHPKVVQQWLKDNNFDSIKEARLMPNQFITARTICWQERISVQSAMQSHIDASISSTINLPASTTIEEIEKIYRYAHMMKCKGVTVFRENCSRTPILKDTSKIDNKEEPIKEAKKVDVEFVGSNLKDILSKDQYNAVEKEAKKLLDDIYTNTCPSCKANDHNISKTLKTVDCTSCKSNSDNIEVMLNGKKYIINKKDYEKIKEMDLPLEYALKDIHVSSTPGMDKYFSDEKCIKSDTKPKTMLTRQDFGEVLQGNTYYMKVACGHIYITVNKYNGIPVEVFMRSSKSGGCAANTNALGRMASTMLRSNIPVEDIVDSVIGIKCDACVKLKGKGEDISGLSCSDVMARVLQKEYNKCLEYNKMKRYVKDIENPDGNTVTVNPEDIKYDYKDYTPQENIDNGICPECGSILTHAGGCVNCTSCGFSLCS